MVFRKMRKAILLGARILQTIISMQLHLYEKTDRMILSQAKDDNFKYCKKLLANNFIRKNNNRLCLKSKYCSIMSRGAIKTKKRNNIQT